MNLIFSVALKSLVLLTTNNNSQYVAPEFSKSYGVCTVRMPILQMRKVRYVEVSRLAHRDPASEWQSQDPNPGSQAPESTLWIGLKDCILKIEPLPWGRHCVGPHSSPASLDTFPDLEWHVSFSLFYEWRGGGFEQWVCQSGGGVGFGIWPVRRPNPSLFMVLLPGVSSSPRLTRAPHPPFSTIMFWTYRLVAKTTTQKQHEGQMTFRTFCSEDDFFFNF